MIFLISANFAEMLSKYVTVIWKSSEVNGNSLETTSSIDKSSLLVWPFISFNNEFHSFGVFCFPIRTKIVRCGQEACIKLEREIFYFRLNVKYLRYNFLFNGFEFFVQNFLISFNFQCVCNMIYIVLISTIIVRYGTSFSWVFWSERCTKLFFTHKVF